MSLPADQVLVRTAALTARERTLISKGTLVTDPQAQLTALRDVAAALGAADVAYALIGGIAVGIRSGVPRATADIDVAVGGAVQRRRVVDILTAAGFVHRGSYEFSENFRHPNGEPVQMAVDDAFTGALARAEVVDLGGYSVVVVRTEDLVAMKERAAADPARRRSKALRDLADVALLQGDVGDEDEGWGRRRDGT